MKVQFSLIRELVLYEFEQSNKAVEATKNFCFAKGESTVDHCIVTRGFKKFLSGCKNLNDQSRSEVILKEWIPKSCSKSLRLIRRVALGEYQSNSASDNPVCFVIFMASAKAYGADKLCHVTKIFQNFWLTIIAVAEENSVVLIVVVSTAAVTVNVGKVTVYQH